jgi:hypothetical protein
VQGGEDLLVREVAGGAEEDERVAVVAHDIGKGVRARGWVPADVRVS